MSATLTPKRDAILMDGMADKLGVAPDRDLDPKRLAALRATCTACTKRDDCILWMLDHARGAEAAPVYCLNRNDLSALRAR